MLPQSLFTELNQTISNISSAEEGSFAFSQFEITPSKHENILRVTDCYDFVMVWPTATGHTMIEMDIQF